MNKRNNYKEKIELIRCLAVTALVTTAPAAWAQQSTNSAVEITRVQLEGEKRGDLDAHFSYAQKALEKRNAREAEWALRRMLEQDPSLDRVKLDLAMVLIPQGKLAEAKKLLSEVRDSRPPAEVVQNINMVLTQIHKLTQPHQLNGGVNVGVNSDSNANAAPSTGDITILDTSIPLGAGAGKKHDTHLFAAMNVGHVYRTELDPNEHILRWKTDLLNYRTRQNDLSNLNLHLVSLRTGPELSLLDSGMKIGVFGSFTNLQLNQRDYLDNTKGELVFEIPATNALTTIFNSSIEYREYKNAPGITTYADRSGGAMQQAAGLRYVLSDRWLLNSNITIRGERAKKNYYANTQAGADAGVTFIIDPQTFINSQLGYKRSVYDEADALTSIKVRSDNEFSAGLTLGRSFVIPEYENSLTLTAGYLYRNVESNIQNYEYDNHRVSTAMSVAF
jgi:hypothetical protein